MARRKFAVKIRGYIEGGARRGEFMAECEIEAAARGVRFFDATDGGVPPGGMVDAYPARGGRVQQFPVPKVREWLDANRNSLEGNG